MDRQTFLDHVRQSGLLTEEQISAVTARFGQEVPAQALASALVDEGLLTRFQAKQIWAEKSRGLVLGQYQVLDELGKGGFGQVFKARHTMMDRVVAIKVISPELLEDERARLWFRREVLACTQFAHANIVMAYDADEVDGQLFLVMEYVDGPNLDSYVKAEGALSVGLACELIRQAALALEHAHEKGVVHRDIKPANLLLIGEALQAISTPDGLDPSRPTPVVVKVTDFGLARLHRSAPAGTLMLQHEKSFMGTPDFVSPEQARNLHAVDIRSDLYSLGCTFYYALTGSRPFRGTTVLETVVQHLEKDPEPLEVVRPDAPAEVGAIIKRLMAKDPAKRFQTPAELVAELLPWCGQPGQAPRASVKSLLPPRPPLNGREPEESAPRSEHDATALVPKLAFWEGPELSKGGGSGAAAVCEAQPRKANANGTAGGSGLRPLPARPLAELAGAPAEPSSYTPRPVLPVLVNRAPAAVAEPEPAAAVALADPPAEREAARPFRPSPALSQAWQRWVTVVEAFAGGESPRINEPIYRTLRQSLLDYCRSYDTAEGPRPAVLDRLEAIVEPWLTSEALAQIDRQTLSSLVVRCRQLEADLGGPSRRSLWSTLAALLALLVAAGFGWYLSQTAVWTSLKPAARWLERAVQSNPLLCIGIAVPVVVLVALFALSRLTRT